MYAQLNPDGTFYRKLPNGNVEWDATHFCPASTLTPEEASQFRVVEYQSTPQPAIDPLTERCVDDGLELVDGQWREKWIVVPLADEEKAALLASKREAMEVSRFQARAALHLTERNGTTLLALVEALMADPNTPVIMRMAWEDAQVFKRMSPTVLSMGAALGMTDEELDQLFETAATIEA